MTRTMTILFRGPLFRFIAVCLTLYAAIAIATEAPILILILNDLVMSAAACVCIAYAPILPEALSNSHPGKGEYLGVGIWFVSASVFLLRVISVIARDLGHPAIYNSDAVTAALMLSLIGALLHLWAPHAVEGRIPRARWLSAGLVVAVGLFVALGCWSLHLSLAHPPVIELR